MTTLTAPIEMTDLRDTPPDTLLRRAGGSGRVVVGGGVLLVIALLCVGTLPFTLSPGSVLYFDGQVPAHVRRGCEWTLEGLFGYDALGRSLLGRCLLGGAISLAIGFAAAGIAVGLGVTVGLLSGFTGGWLDALLMRSVDVLYGLPYILLVILFKIALEGPLGDLFARVPGIDPTQTANLVVLFLAIGLVSWLTMARVVRGQVLSIREMPYIEACRAMGLRRPRIFMRHVLPNLLGPIIVYATLTVPSAILQESFLSFLGVGVRLPLPTWGSLASDGVAVLSPVKIYWWVLVFPCALLMITLLCLNFLGDGLRDLFDPRRKGRG